MPSRTGTSNAYLWVLANLRMPTLSLGLKPISGYLGFRPPPT
jgi:hypothetical protein